MKLKTCLKHFGTQQFEEELFDELQTVSNELPLENYCEQGGSPAWDEDVEIEDLQLKNSNSTPVTGSFHISFTESYYRGCPDIDFKERYSGRMEFSLDVESGNIEFLNPVIRRVYEEDEF
jgi:hypothetical protein